MTMVTVFGSKKFGAQIQLFLAYLYCQKQLKMTISIKNGIIPILKSILKEGFTHKKVHLLKQSMFV